MCRAVGEDQGESQVKTEKSVPREAEETKTDLGGGRRHIIVVVVVTDSSPLVSLRESRSVDQASVSGSSQAGHQSSGSRGKGASLEATSTRNTSTLADSDEHGVSMKWGHSFLVATTWKTQSVIENRPFFCVRLVWSSLVRCKKKLHLWMLLLLRSVGRHPLRTACTWQMMKNEHVVKTNSAINMSTHMNT